MTAAPIWHLAEPADWAEARRTGTYTGSTRGATLAEVGFVHCSSPAQLPGVVANFYSDVSAEMIVLELDRHVLDHLGSPVRDEPGNPDDPASPLFPHVYGPIPLDAVLRVIPARVERGRLEIDEG